VTAADRGDRSFRKFRGATILSWTVGEIIPELWMMNHAHHRGSVKKEQAGELTVLTPNLRPASIAK
jgi:hypothetical protein